MILECFVVGMLQTNCYLLGDEKTKDALIIDPGAEGLRVVQRTRDLGLKAIAILNTHGHFDHVMDSWLIKEHLGCEIFLHPRDLSIMQSSLRGMGTCFSPSRKLPDIAVDRDLLEGNVIECGAIKLRVIETPGHTPGHVSFYAPEMGVLFVGDTLFAGSIGRTDLPGGSYPQLILSVRNKIFPLDGNTVVYPGHGPQTTVEREIRSNPFFR